MTRFLTPTIMHFTLVSISRKALDFPSIEYVTIPTRGGEITILPNHEALITALSPGVLIVRVDGKNTHRRGQALAQIAKIIGEFVHWHAR